MRQTKPLLQSSSVRQPSEPQAPGAGVGVGLGVTLMLIVGEGVTLILGVIEGVILGSLTWNVKLHVVGFTMFAAGLETGALGAVAVLSIRCFWEIKTPAIATIKKRPSPRTAIMAFLSTPNILFDGFLPAPFGPA